MIIALTGHRTDKIADERRVRETVRRMLREAQPRAVVCGMANGFDLFAGHEAINLGLHVWAAKPWQTHKPRKGDEHLYGSIEMFAERVVVVTDVDKYPGPWVYQKRNEWMVDNATHVLAYWDGSAGGTANCVRYARGKKPIRNIYAAASF